MASGTPTPKLLLPQYGPLDDMDYNEVNQAFSDIDTKATVTSFATANRPTGVDRFDGRIIKDTDLGQYLVWNATNNEWQVVRYDLKESPVVTATPAANFTSPTIINAVQRNGMMQIYCSVVSTLAQAAGDVSNKTMFTLSANARPLVPAVGSGGASGPMVGVYITTGGAASLVSTATGVNAGDTITFGACYLLA